MGRRADISVGLVAAVVLCLWAPASSFGSASGEIFHAVGEEGAVSSGGGVEWEGCDHRVPPTPPRPPTPPYPPGYPWEVGPYVVVSPSPPYCGWIPFATIGPGSSEADCSSADRARPDELGEDVRLVWLGEEQRALGSQEFDASALSASEETDRLVCLSLIEIAPVAVVCPMIVGIDCPPFVMAEFSHELDAALVEWRHPASNEEGTDDSGSSPASGGTPPSPAGSPGPPVSDPPSASGAPQKHRGKARHKRHRRLQAHRHKAVA